MKYVFFATFTGKAVRLVALRSCQRDVTHQYKQIQNGGTETMWLILKCIFFLEKGLGRNIDIE